MERTEPYDRLLDLVTKRRSVRRFKPDFVPDEYITKIIEVHHDACGVEDFRTDDEMEAYARVTKTWCIGEHRPTRMCALFLNLGALQLGARFCHIVTRG